MVWDSHSSNTKEPNVDKREQVMGFRTKSIAMQNILKRIHRRILWQLMDVHYIKSWIFTLTLAKHKHFDQQHPPIPPTLSHVAPPTRSTMSMQGGMNMLQHDKLNILGNCGFKDTKGDLWVWNKDLVLWDMVAFPHILCNNHMPCLQP